MARTGYILPVTVAAWTLHGATMHGVLGRFAGGKTRGGLTSQRSARITPCGQLEATCTTPILARKVKCGSPLLP